jgi:hypothetical protein
VTFDFEPFKPINSSLSLCDNKFHTEALNELLESDDKFGFIIMDGNGTLFGTLSGNTRVKCSISSLLIFQKSMEEVANLPSGLLGFVWRNAIIM